MKIDLTKLLANYSGQAEKKVKKYAKEDKTWYYVQVVLTLFTVSFFVLFAIRPAVVTISGLVGEIKRKQELSNKMQNKINTLVAAQQEYSTVQKNWELIASYLPSEFKATKAFAQLSGLSQDYNLNPGKMSFSKLDFIKHTVGNKKQNLVGLDNQNLNGLPYSSNVNGDLFTLKDYLSQVGRSRRWTTIQGYQLSKKQDDDEDQTPGINLSVDGNWLFWKKK